MGIEALVQKLDQIRPIRLQSSRRMVRQIHFDFQVAAKQGTAISDPFSKPPNFDPG